MTRLSLRSLALAGAGLSLVTASVALAAPDRTATLPEFTWDGGPMSGAILGVDDDRDSTLVKLSSTASSLVVKLTDFQDAGGEPDFDIRLYQANAEGDPEGAAIAEAIEADTTQETLSVKNLAAGDYVIEVNAFLTVEGTFKGKLTVTGGGAGAPAPGPAPGPGATPTPAPGGGPATPPPGGQPAVNQAPEAKITKIAKKLKKISGTASDDGKVKRVQIAIQSKKGSKCKQMNRKGKLVKQKKCDAPTSWLTAKGTSKWSFKLPKKAKLKKGKYTVFARATDDAGTVQTTFTPSNKRKAKA